MYSDYLYMFICILLVVLNLGKDVCTSLLIRGKEWETLYFPHLTPPLAFPQGEKNILYSISYEFLLRVKKMPVMWRAMLWHK